MKGFIEVTEAGSFGNKVLIHYSQIQFVYEHDRLIPLINGRVTIKEEFEEIKELIKNAQ